MLAKSPSVTLYTEGFSHFVTSITAPVASGWSTLAGWDSHPLESATFHGARRTRVVKLERHLAALSPVVDPANSEPTSESARLTLACTFGCAPGRAVRACVHCLKRCFARGGLVNAPKGTR